ncbi:hypothetical protein [Flavobacterium muglaense]|uniref:Lipoprotein n=1 Tax=Flavobacterium muglaense TaxID=2764716 RepID=A0A923SI33_9FLAO|nr:hypothetical protein [Flavobacterium muglaense]MBC5836393.1 hypothetical protein [Flavobacterium muglaense]MBC5842923.1 hypothetical protein [Flavobacterium muglaense]
MKKIYVVLLSIFVFTSCTIKEKMVMNEDGSGTFSYGFDVSALMKMGKSTDSTKVPKVMDSTFTFKEIMLPLKDSISKLSEVEKAQFKLLEGFRVKMKINEIEKEFSYDMEFDFPAVDSMSNMMSPTKAASLLSLSDKKIPAKKITPAKDKNASNTSFSYDGKYFTKTVTLTKSQQKKLVKEKSKTQPQKEEEPEDEFSKKLGDFLKECKYSIEYHFPKKIKTVSMPGVVIAADRKSFVKDIAMENLSDNMDLSFKVEFE